MKIAVRFIMILGLCILQTENQAIEHITRKKTTNLLFYVVYKQLNLRCRIDSLRNMKYKRHSTFSRVRNTLGSVCRLDISNVRNIYVSTSMQFLPKYKKYIDILDLIYKIEIIDINMPASWVREPCFDI